MTRALIAVLLAMLMSGFAAAQNAREAQPNPNQPNETSTWPSSPYVNPDLRNGASDQQDNVCYTMRTYLFARRDGGPLEQVATFTCTPSRQRDLKRAKAEPKLVPAK